MIFYVNIVFVFLQVETDSSVTSFIGYSDSQGQVYDDKSAGVLELCSMKTASKDGDHDHSRNTGKSDVYWKIGLCLSDVNFAVKKIKEKKQSECKVLGFRIFKFL